MYFLLSEALANVVKHAKGTGAFVAVDRVGDRLGIEVTDDGVGGAAVDGGTGLRGLADRVEAIGDGSTFGADRDRAPWSVRRCRARSGGR